MEDNNLELLFDVFEESILYLYNITKFKYFDLFFLTANNILAGEVLNDFTLEQINDLNEIYSKLEDVDLNVDTILKVVQALVLKGFKEQRLMSVQTPDTIGFFVAYLMKKLVPDTSFKNVLDPLVGTGNMLFNINNHLENKLNLFGIDNDMLMIEICKTTANLLDTNITINYQDTTSLKQSNMDFVVFDSDNIIADGKNELYNIINHHITSLNDNGYMIGIISDDFFDYDSDSSFKKELISKATIIGLISLPQDMFKTISRSIIIIKKDVISDKKCLMLKLPSFSNVSALNNALQSIETWFNKNLN